MPAEAMLSNRRIHGLERSKSPARDALPVQSLRGFMKGSTSSCVHQPAMVIKEGICRLVVLMTLRSATRAQPAEFGSKLVQPHAARP